jgi:hypothetical protein
MKYCNQLATEIEDYRAYVSGSMCETDMVWARTAARMTAILDRPHTARVCRRYGCPYRKPKPAGEELRIG